VVTINTGTYRWYCAVISEGAGGAMRPQKYSILIFRGPFQAQWNLDKYIVFQLSTHLGNQSF